MELLLGTALGMALPAGLYARYAVTQKHRAEHAVGDAVRLLQASGWHKRVIVPEGRADALTQAHRASQDA